MDDKNKDSPGKSSSTSDLPNLLGMDYVNIQRRSHKRGRDVEDIDYILDKYSSGITAQLQTFKKDLEACVETKLSSLHDQFKADIKGDFDYIKSELKMVSDRQNTLAADHELLVQRTDSIEKKSQANCSDIAILNEEISNLQSDINNLQQRDRLQNLEISGIPDKKNENLSTYVMNIARFVGIEMSLQDIEYVTRAQRKNKKTNNPKTIIVKLKTRLLRDRIISGVRTKKSITTADIGISVPGEPSQVFINEHLTPSNKLLYLQARRKKKASSHFKYVWIRDGKIFARKDDDTPLFLIRSANDLDKIS